MFHSWFLSIAVLGFVLTAALAPSLVMAASDLNASARTPVGTPRIVVRGTFTSGTHLTITLEGVSPPTTTPPVPPFMVVIRLNGWKSASPTPVWDDQNQVWTIIYKIPSGSRGAVIGITAMMFGTGNSTSASVTVQ